MRTAVGRVIDAKYDLPGERLLQAQVPLVDFRVACFLEIQVISVRQSPLGELAIFRSLRILNSCRKGIFKRGRSSYVVVLGEKYCRGAAECCTWILEVGRHVHAVVDPGSSAHNGPITSLIGKAESRRGMVAINGG